VEYVAHQRRKARAAAVAKLLPPTERPAHMQPSCTSYFGNARTRSNVAATSRSLDSRDHRRRRSTDVISSYRKIVIPLLPGLAL
jgi:hypothetical protein